MTELGTASVGLVEEPVVLTSPDRLDPQSRIWVDSLRARDEAAIERLHELLLRASPGASRCCRTCAAAISTTWPHRPRTTLS